MHDLVKSGGYKVTLIHSNKTRDEIKQNATRAMSFESLIAIEGDDSKKQNIPSLLDKGINQELTKRSTTSPKEYITSRVVKINDNEKNGNMHDHKKSDKIFDSSLTFKSDKQPIILNTERMSNNKSGGCAKTKNCNGTENQNLNVHASDINISKNPKNYAIHLDSASNIQKEEMACEAKTKSVLIDGTMYCKHSLEYCKSCCLDFRVTNRKKEDSNQKKRSAKSKINNADYPVENLYCCGYCHEMFPQMESLDVHLSITGHKEVKHESSVAVNTLECEECQRKFRKLPSLEQHQKLTGHANKTWKCLDCGIKFLTEYACSHHQISKGHGAPFSKFDKLTIDSDDTDGLLADTTGAQLILCEWECRECLAQFDTRKSLKAHQDEMKHDGKFEIGFDKLKNDFVKVFVGKDKNVEESSNLNKPAGICRRSSITNSDSTAGVPREASQKLFAGVNIFHGTDFQLKAPTSFMKFSENGKTSISIKIISVMLGKALHYENGILSLQPLENSANQKWIYDDGFLSNATAPKDALDIYEWPVYTTHFQKLALHLYPRKLCNNENQKWIITHDGYIQCHLGLFTANVCIVMQVGENEEVEGATRAANDNQQQKWTIYEI